ncbi:YidC/Oxa1 family insertase periplasmic-domain containing protein, partial [Vibrio parahaemolyticus]
SIQRQGMPQLTPINIIHEGGIGALGVDKPELKLLAFKDWKKKLEQTESSKGGWLGVTDKYWLAAVAPDQGETVKASFRVNP